jgi:ATP-binding cassette subfamily F protein 3
MAFVQISRVSLAFGDRDILKDITIHLAAGTRAALAGTNGSGKSTLMKVIAGALTADSGDRTLQKSCRVSYLPQSGGLSREGESWKDEPVQGFSEGRTLREEAETAYGPIRALAAKMEDLGRVLEQAVRDDGKTAALLEEYRRLEEAVEHSGYYDRERRIAGVLRGLGFSPGDMDRRTGEFSGGWQMRIALAKVLLEEPDILLLDEPTNYRDLAARSWLERRLRDFPGGYLLVSHDRYFLDVTVSEVYELFQGALKRYAGNYSAYEEIRRGELESLTARYRLQQEEIAKTEALIRKFRYKASKAAFAQELVKRLEKMERIEIPESLKKIRIAFPPPPQGGRIALTVEGLGKRYGDLRVFSGLDLTLEAGEKLAAVGPNGAGKSTLLRILAGADGDFEGRLRYGAGISLGYFSQDAAEAMTGSETVLEFLEGEASAAPARRTSVRDMLGSFLFRGDDVFKPVSVLSGGEKSRLALLQMLLKPMNLLILDEPTNHLDLYSKDLLLDALRQFPGAIVFVSHDRSFMEALSTKTLELSRSSPVPRLFYGNYGYYLDRLEREAEGGSFTGHLSALPPSGPAPTSGPKTGGSHGPTKKAPLASSKGPPDPPGTGAWEAAKQRQALIRRRERQEAEILRQVEALEGEKARLEAELARPEVYSNGEKARSVQARIEETAAGIEAKTREWEELGTVPSGAP